MQGLLLPETVRFKKVIIFRTENLGISTEKLIYSVVTLLRSFFLLLLFLEQPSRLFIPRYEISSEDITWLSERGSQKKTDKNQQQVFSDYCIMQQLRSSFYIIFLVFF